MPDRHPVYRIGHRRTTQIKDNPRIGPFFYKSETGYYDGDPAQQFPKAENGQEECGVAQLDDPFHILTRPEKLCSTAGGDCECDEDGCRPIDDPYANGSAPGRANSRHPFPAIGPQRPGCNRQQCQHQRAPGFSGIPTHKMGNKRPRIYKEQSRIRPFLRTPEAGNHQNDGGQNFPDPKDRQQVYRISQMSENLSDKIVSGQVPFRTQGGFQYNQTRGDPISDRPEKGRGRTVEFNLFHNDRFF